MGGAPWMLVFNIKADYPCRANRLLVATALGICGLYAVALTPASAAEAADAAAASPEPTLSEPLTEIFITAPEPRYVAPTRRDRIGRIWAPVYINGKGPFRMVLDTGANRSGVIASVAQALGLPPDFSSSVILHGVTGSTPVATIKVDTLLVGDVLMNGSRLPILPDALGGAEGILGTEGLTDRRVFIDFHHDLIIISRSHNQPAPAGFVTIPFHFERGRLLVTEVVVGNVRAKAILDTGGEVTVANLAMREALSRRALRNRSVDQIEGVTKDIEEGEGYPPPQIAFGTLEIRSAHMTFADMNIFKHWHLTDEPALLIGLDVIGLLDTLIIDYKRHELQLHMRPS